jgi:hypothetical protein
MPKFPWGKVVDRFDYDFEGQSFEVIKYHPRIYINGTGTDQVDTDSISYHCPQIRTCSYSLFELLVCWLATQSLSSTEALYVAPAVSRALGLNKACNANPTSEENYD